MKVQVHWHLVWWAFTAFLKEQTKKTIKGQKKHSGAADKSSSEQQFPKSYMSTWKIWTDISKSNICKVIAKYLLLH